MVDRELCESPLTVTSRRSRLTYLCTSLADRDSFFARAADGMEERVGRYKKTISVRVTVRHDEAGWTKYLADGEYAATQSGHRLLIERYRVVHSSRCVFADRDCASHLIVTQS